MTDNRSTIRHNFHEECEAAINKQINMELYASYVYLSMAYYFDRDDVAFNNVHLFFKQQSDEEREHAQKLMKYQNKRGGRIVLQDVKRPVVNEWGSILQAMQAALDLEKTVNLSLLHIHEVADRHEDAQFSDFIEQEFLEEQVESIKKLGDYITSLKNVGSGLGEYMFDKETLSSS
ncbi:soma ferritin-like protein [Leptotrombidium deliense]|uniref:Ferritin n=1 Tax=Leptotrombidium deliense TaxID=299467 RepID=A0A443S3Y6_9ACAR|nr:soma ferritin-like protein [Leptotrombidium deliense]